MTSLRRTIFIGDVHGCLDELRALLVACDHRASDRVVLVGDLVAKGPASFETVRFAREQGFLAVQGNHDARWLSWNEGRHAGASRGRLSAWDTASALRFEAEDWAWLGALPLYLEFPEHDVVAVHGGLLPGVPLSDQSPKDLLTMRSITAEGLASSRVEAGLPWAGQWPGPAHVIFGHDAMRGLQQYPFATGLDTGCVYGRSLTALILPQRNLLSVPAARVYCNPLTIEE